MRVKHALLVESFARAAKGSTWCDGISVLNLEGEIVHQQHGLGVDPHETVAEVSDLLEGRAPDESAH